MPSHEPVIKFDTNAKRADVSAYSLKVLKDILAAAGLKSAMISSTARGPADQARVMYDNLVTYGVDHQKNLYAAAGDSIIDVYVDSKAAGKSPDEIKADMTAAIIEIGPGRVSRHAADPRILNVFDVAPSSISDKPAFEAAVRAERRVARFLLPPGDPGYHLEIPQGKA